jgi:catechol 2,3-dioxygenase-like lactoylglutathione lyase family enzyme
MMRTPFVFVIGLVVGAAAATGVAQTERLTVPSGLTHVGLSVTNYDQALEYYTKKVGLPVAFEIKEPDGTPFLASLRVSPTMSLEILPANADRKPGIDHFGIESEDTRAAVTLLRQRGVTVEEARVGRTKAIITFAQDPAGNKMEIGQFGPDSLQRQTSK